MSVSQTRTFLLTLRDNNYIHAFEELIFKRIPFEILNPMDLGTEWSNVTLAKPPVYDHKAKLRLEEILSQLQPKGIDASLVDHRPSGTLELIATAKDQEPKLTQAIKDLDTYFLLSEEIIKIQQLHEDNSGSNIVFGYRLDAFREKIEEFEELRLQEFLKDHPSSETRLEHTDTEVINISTFQALIFKPEHKEFIRNFATSHANEFTLHSYDDFISSLQSERSEVKQRLEAVHFDTNGLSQKNYTILCALHAWYELQTKLSQDLGYVFKLNKDDSSGANFAFISIPNTHANEFLEYIEQNPFISIQKTDWNQEIVVWKPSQKWRPFQSIAASLGTIDTKEVDPSPIIAIFFCLFFAFCLGDALYGLILMAFSGYYLNVKPVKPNFKDMFNLFFYSGLVTVVLGAMLNSWAGDLFIKTPLNPLFQSIQLINLLDPLSTAPINQFLLSNGGISPIVAMLALSVFIGLIGIQTGNIIKLINSYRDGNSRNIAEDATWILFTSMIVVYPLSMYIHNITSYILGIVTLFSICGLFVFNNGNGVVGKILSGLGKLYNLIGFFADALSFTRLIAVGLTGGIIASVINLLATVVYGLVPIPVVNIILAAIVLIVGHIFNLAVSLFGAYINPLRLHYVELLPKFYEGRGRSLRPITTNFTFLRIEQ